MQLDVVNHENKKVGTVDVNDEVFGGRINGDLMWESVVHANAADRSGTHAAKTRAFVSGTGKKPWKQKGTGRAQVGSSRTPLWRHGGTSHPPRPRSYDFKLSKIKAGEVIVVDALGVSEPRTKAAVELLKRLGITGKAVLVDVSADEKLSRSVRNIPGVSLVASARLTAREVIGAGRVVATRSALEKLQEALA